MATFGKLAGPTERPKWGALPRGCFRPHFDPIADVQSWSINARKRPLSVVPGLGRLPQIFPTIRSRR